MKPFIYLASPYTKGDPCINTNFQMRMFAQFVREGIVDAYIPLWSHFQHSAFPEPYTTWIEYDKAIIRRLDGVLRLNAEIPELNYFEDKSSGADGEAALGKALGLPVWYSVNDMYAYFYRKAVDELSVVLREERHAESMEAAVDALNRKEELVDFINRVRKVTVQLDGAGFEEYARSIGLLP